MTTSPPAGRCANVSLNVHLRLLALRGCRKCNESKDSRADSFGNSLDDPTLAGGVATFENHHDLQFFVLNPELQFHELGLEFREMLLEIFAL